jgi:2,4-dienoyl-CoA reductase-like NADH-dependent reductase (Old Yellow Enzyme family)
MCQYSSVDGKATDWHLVHLGSRAAGGAALVMVEATAVERRGVISPDDMGIWSARFVNEQGAVSGIQLAHAGRKAGTRSPWKGGGPLSEEECGFRPVAPSAIPFATGYQVPHELTPAEIEQIADEFQRGALRAVDAGFKLIEIHSAHGYLLHSFLSPLTNKRTDNYGGAFERRAAFLLGVSSLIRNVIPEEMPLFVRISATDWVDGGWDLEQSIELAKRLKGHGVDLIDCSSGAIVPDVRIPVQPGYQVPFAEAIKQKAGILTAAVGMITDARQADAIIRGDQADMVLLAREMLRDPYWPLHAAVTLGEQIEWPVQYLRARN